MVLICLIVIYLVVYYGIETKYKASADELNNLRKERKRIKRNLDRLENPKDSDFDDLHDIEDDINDKQKEVNEYLGKKVKLKDTVRAIVIIYFVVLVISLALVFLFTSGVLYFSK